MIGYTAWGLAHYQPRNVLYPPPMAAPPVHRSELDPLPLSNHQKSSPRDDRAGDSRRFSGLPSPTLRSSPTHYDEKIQSRCGEKSLCV